MRRSTCVPLRERVAPVTHTADDTRMAHEREPPHSTQWIRTGTHTHMKRYAGERRSQPDSPATPPSGTPTPPTTPTTSPPPSSSGSPALRSSGATQSPSSSSRQPRRGPRSPPSPPTPLPGPPPPPPPARSYARPCTPTSQTSTKLLLVRRWLWPLWPPWWWAMAGAAAAGSCKGRARGRWLRRRRPTPSRAWRRERALGRAAARPALAPNDTRDATKEKHSKRLIHIVSVLRNSGLRTSWGQGDIHVFSDLGLKSTQAGFLFLSKHTSGVVIWC